MLQNTNLEVALGEPLTVEVVVEGNQLPASVLLESEGGRFRMQRVRPHTFRHTFPAVRKEAAFKFLANGWTSQEFLLEPFAMPMLAELNIEATPPSYTGLPRLVQRNQGDLTVPEGTPVEWTITVADADRLRMVLGEQPLATRALGANVFRANCVASNNALYWVTPSSDLAMGDSLRHRLRVIPDIKPAIKVEEVVDSTSRKLRHFTGAVQDDYGFSRLTFVWRFAKQRPRNSSPEELLASEALSPPPPMQGKVELKVPSGRQDSFFHTWEMDGLDWQEGDVLECWFELWDNDGVHGAKMVRSTTTKISAPSQEDILAERDEAAASIENDLQDAAEEAAELREAMEAMQERLREQGEMTWQDRQAMEDLMEQQKELQEKLEAMQEENERKDERANEFSKQEVI